MFQNIIQIMKNKLILLMIPKGDKRVPLKTLAKQAILKDDGIFMQ